MNPWAASMVPLEYVALESYEGKLIIMPVAATKDCEVLQDMLHAVNAMHLYSVNEKRDAFTRSESQPSYQPDTLAPLDRRVESAQTTTGTATCEQCVQDEPNKGGVCTRDMSVAEANAESRVDEYYCMGVTFAPLESRMHASLSQNGVQPMLRIPLLCIKYDTLLLIAQFLIGKSSSSADDISQLRAISIFESFDEHESKSAQEAMHLLCAAEYLDV